MNRVAVVVPAHDEQALLPGCLTAVLEALRRLPVRSEVIVVARFDPRSILIEVRDDGPGFSPEVLAKLGEPYVTSRPGAEGSRTGHIGMGLGFFIAKTLLERTGAAVDFRNGRRGGAVVAARWPRPAMEAPGFIGV